MRRITWFDDRDDDFRGTTTTITGSLVFTLEDPHRKSYFGPKNLSPKWRFLGKNGYKY